MNSGIRFGYVVKADVKNGVYRVNIDADDIVTDWLPRLEMNTKDTNSSNPLKEGEHVALLMDEHNEAGVILGAIFDKKNTPNGIIANDNLHAVRFEDGTKITYDKGAGVYTIDCVGKIIIKSAAEVEINCTTLKVTGDISATGDITTLTGDVTAGVISLTNHIHAVGSPNTGPPL